MVGGPPELRLYRGGLKGIDRSGKQHYLSAINEAVTEELALRYFSEILKDRVFQKDIAKTKRLIGRNQQGLPPGTIFNERGYYFAEILKPKNADETSRLLNAEGIRVKGTLSLHRPMYREERGVFNLLVDKLFEKNKDTVKDREEIFDLFARGAMTGNILPLAKLVETTFGPGTFRTIAEFNSDVKGLGEYVKGLQTVG